MTNLLITKILPTILIGTFICQLNIEQNLKMYGLLLTFSSIVASDYIMRWLKPVEDDKFAQ